MIPENELDTSSKVSRLLQIWLAKLKELDAKERVLLADRILKDTPQPYEDQQSVLLKLTATTLTKGPKMCKE